MNSFTYNFVMSIGWGAASDVAKRAMLKYVSPQKRGTAATFLTVDQV